MTGSTYASLIHGRDIADELADVASRDPDRLYATDGDRQLTVGDLDTLTDAVATTLAESGVGDGARVAVSLPNTALHVATVFALIRLRAVWVPLNPELRGAPLAHVLADSGTTHLIADERSDISAAVGADRLARHGVSLGSGTVIPDAGEMSVQLWRCDDGGRYPELIPDTSLVMYTSGTTGPPKGVRVSQTMLRAAAAGAVEVTEVRPGDVFYLWEPLFHIGGAQNLLLPLYTESSLALAPRFSASRFWADIRRTGATHIHYLGGILQILLQLPVSADERRHQVRIAWGAGLTPETWEACQRRFGFALHECYGSTETSSIVTMNRGSPDAGIGTPLPWFDVRLDGREILVRGKVPGVVTQGYLGNEEATRKSLAGEWFRTGDHGEWDDAGNFHFIGRASDSVRVRGENVSAWQVESVFANHPDVDRCAVVGVSADVGEQEIMLVLTTVDGHPVDPEMIRDWGAEQLASFQLPRYIKVIDEMPLTPSQRVAKHRLATTVTGATDCR